MRQHARLWPLILLIAFAGCGAKPKTLEGKWETAMGLILNLRGDGKFSMGSKQSDEDFAGSWRVVGDELKLDTATLAGKPVEQSLTEKMEEVPADLRPNAEGRDKHIAQTRQMLNITLKISLDRTRLTWFTAGRETVFTRPEAHAAGPTEVEIAAKLRKGMPVHEVMEFFRTNESTATGSPDDPSILISVFEMGTGQNRRVIRTTYKKQNDKPGLETVEVQQGSEFRTIPIK